MADSSVSKLYYVAESEWGTTPASALAGLRFTGETLNFNISNIESNEIQENSEITDLVQTSAEASGDINFELSFGSYDSFLESALRGTWAYIGGTTVDKLEAGATASNLDFVFDSTAKTLTIGSAHETVDVLKGQWVRIGGTGVATGNAGYRLVTNVSGNVLTLDTVATTETVQTNGYIQGCRLRNGTIKKSFTIERYHPDITPVAMFGFTGMVVSGLSMTIATQSIMTGSFSFTGKEASIGSVHLGNQSVTAADMKKSVMNSVSHFGDVRTGATLTPLTGTFVRDISFSINNNLRGKPAVGHLGNVDVSLGRFQVNGNLTVYFENTDLYNAYVNSTDSGFAYYVQDTDGNAYRFSFPRIKISTDRINAEANDQDVVEQMNFTALRHATYGHTLEISKFPAVA
jgi:hypothetical protein